MKKRLSDVKAEQEKEALVLKWVARESKEAVS